jgi:hypothetical protein
LALVLLLLYWSRAVLVVDYLAAITVAVMLCLGYNLFKVSSKFISGF